MMKFCLKSLWMLYLLLLIQYKFAHTQPRDASPSAGELFSSIQKLNVLGSVLYFAAHPDDENTRLIAWLANEKKYRTAYLSLTRGDGGQNLIGTELAEELGLIRTQELMLARQIDGGEQYFSRANDFGFSKTPEETLEFWGKDSVLADAVWLIRKLRPDVIITRFPSDSRGGHGHHQAATILAIEAFEAASDPTRFTEQLVDVEPWQAKRLLWNTANFGGQNNTSPDQFNMDIGDFSPLLGKSYGEIAADSRSSHKSQGFGAARQRGSVREYFETTLGEAPTESLMDGVVTTWDRVPGGERITPMIDQLIERYDLSHPEKSLPDLIGLLQALEQLPKNYWTELKRSELQDIILASAGIWLGAYAETPKSVEGEAVAVQTEMIVRRPGVEVELQSIAYFNGEELTPDDGQQAVPVLLDYNHLHVHAGSFHAGQTTQPYWLRQARTNELYNVSNPRFIGEAENPDHPYVRIVLNIDGVRIPITRPVQYKYVDPVHGEVQQALAIAPRLTVNLPERALVFVENTEKQIDVVFTSHASGSQTVSVRAEVPQGWTIAPQELSLSFEGADEELIRRFVLRPATEVRLNQVNESAEELRFVVQPENRYAKMIRIIEHDHIPLITHFPEASIRLTQLQTKSQVRKVGYIEGAGDLIPQALRQIGIQVDLLKEKDLLERDLMQYDAIVSGIRAYNVHERMESIHTLLMEYVKTGGTYLVQYNVNNRLATSDLGPYPFNLSRLRVTEEDAPVTFLLPEHPVLNRPDQIGVEDFEGWVQERGLYFATEVDDAYELPLAMNDEGEPALDGSLMVTNVGKGRFVYTSLAFFRQLPAGVPGAYRLFLNLLGRAEHP